METRLEATDGGLKMPIKITNLGKSIRKINDGGQWVFIPSKDSHIMKHDIASDQLFIKDSETFKVEEVDEEGKKIKKTKGEQ